mmetsp:Transcript_24987/g.68647  ORF Transcript_24987/g.68647 Transcript_24987/m.68647 type:complete len:241 (-) Transcript_24987:625-1347(-)
MATTWQAAKMAKGRLRSSEYRRLLPNDPITKPLLLKANRQPNAEPWYAGGTISAAMLHRPAVTQISTDKLTMRKPHAIAFRLTQSSATLPKAWQAQAVMMVPREPSRRAIGPMQTNPQMKAPLVEQMKLASENGMSKTSLKKTGATSTMPAKQRDSMKPAAQTSASEGLEATVANVLAMVTGGMAPSAPPASSACLADGMKHVAKAALNHMIPAPMKKGRGYEIAEAVSATGGPRRKPHA